MASKLNSLGKLWWWGWKISQGVNPRPFSICVLYHTDIVVYFDGWFTRKVFLKEICPCWKRQGTLYQKQTIYVIVAAYFMHSVMLNCFGASFSKSHSIYVAKQDVTIWENHHLCRFFEVRLHRCRRTWRHHLGKPSVYGHKSEFFLIILVLRSLLLLVIPLAT